VGAEKETSEEVTGQLQRRKEKIGGQLNKLSEEKKAPKKIHAEIYQLGSSNQGERIASRPVLFGPVLTDLKGPNGPR